MLEIKKYKNNRKMYVRGRGYINREDVQDYIRKGKEFYIKSEETGEDVTAQVLLEMLLKRENEALTRFSVPTLRLILANESQTLTGYIEALKQGVDLTTGLHGCLPLTGVQIVD